MNYTPLDLETIKHLYRKHIAGPLMVFALMVVLAALTAFVLIFIQESL